MPNMESAGALPARSTIGETRMCRNIKTLFNFDPPASELVTHSTPRNREVETAKARAAALVQFAQ